MINIEESSQNIKSDTFCESFFLASFPTENGKIIEDSENDTADCTHPRCSVLPAMQPEIIYKYPQQDTKGLELNNLAASICFPNGIKLCYEQDEQEIRTVKNYRSSFTNQVGDRFFAVTYHFFLKMLNNDLGNIYSMNPIKYQLTTYQDELTTTFRDELTEDIMNKLDIYSELNFRDNVYIPFCLCLVSKYPFFDQMEKCLESIMISINNYETTPQELNHLIAYIVESIPAPVKKSKISFALPHINKLCEIQYPYFEDILQFGDNPIIILKHLSIPNIIYIIRLLILEQKILVVGRDNDIVSQIILNFVSLLYPFEWIHTYIPIMSEKMLKFLQAFLPFFNGMDHNLYQKAKPLLAKAGKGVFIIDVDNNTIDINSNLRKNAKYTKATTYINKYLDNLPKNIENLLFKELKSIKNDFENTENHNYERSAINIRLKNLFLHVFVELIYDYKKYSHIIDGFPVFNSFLMINEKPKSDKDFYKELTSTQLFQMFIQSSFFNDEEGKNFYFDEYLKNYNKLKNQGYNSNYIFSELSENFENKYISNIEINKNYIVKPYFMKNFNKLEEKYDNKNIKVKLRDIISFVSKEFLPYERYLNSHGVLKENRRFVGRPIKISNENDPKNFVKFIIPENKIDKNIDKDNQENDDGKKKEIETNTNITKDNSNKIKRKSTRMRIISGEGNNNVNYSVCIRNKGVELTEDQIDDLKDSVREIMTRVYKSELKNIVEDEKTIMEIIKTKFGRDHFVNVISLGNKKDKVIKILQKDSYNFMNYVIFNSLLSILELEENEENIKCAINLLKTCLYIKTIKNKKEYLLSDDLFPKLEQYSLFTKKIFWKIWIEDDMTESDIEIFKLAKKSKTENNSIDENSDNYKLYLRHSYEVMDGLASIMIKMKLTISFIYLTFAELSKEYIINDDLFNQLMQEFINELYFYKKLSNK